LPFYVAHSRSLESGRAEDALPGYRCVILRPPFEPCVRFSRTRLTDTVHRQACAGA
jgi:hypothetical protein